MTLLEDIKNNDTLAWSVDKFVKVGLIGFLTVSVILIAKAVVGFNFDFNMGFGL